MRIVRYSIWSLLALSSTTLHAQIRAELDSVVISATRLASTAEEAGRSVSIITQQDIQAMPVTSADELLRFLPGINMNSRGRFGVQADVGIRGSTFSQVLFMVDNVRLNDPLTAHFNNNIPVPLAEIGQIEIIRGPASASFGADAVGGVVHLKTKTYLAQEEDKIEVLGTVSAGAHALLDADAGVHYQRNKLVVSASAKTTISDGESLRNPNFDAGFAADSLYNTYFDLRTYSASLGYFINEKWKVYARAGFDQRDFNAKYFYTRSVFDESVEQTESQWYQGALIRENGGTRTEINGGYKITDDLFTFNPAFAPNDHRTTQLNFSATHSLPLSDRINLAFGAQLVQQDIVSTDRGDHNNLSLGAYGIASWYLTSNFKATGSLRIEYNDNFKVKVLPQLNLAYVRGKYVLRGSFGKSIRAADFTERYVSSEIPNLTPGRNIGNPDLDAESAWSFDAGVDFLPNPGSAISATIFYRLSDNLIDYTLTNSDDIDNTDNLQPGEEYLYATNISDSRVFGIELLWNRRFIISDRSYLNLNLAYTLLETSNSDVVVSKNISNHPQHAANLVLQYRTGRFELTAANNFVDRRGEFDEVIGAEIPDSYFVTDVKFGVHLVRDKLVVFGKALNLFDTEYADILGATMPGQWFAAGVQCNMVNSAIGLKP